MKRVVIDDFTKGMNNAMLKYMVPQGMVCDIVNYEYALDGRLSLRANVDVFEDLRHVQGTIIGMAIWYPNRKAREMTGDVIYIIQTYNGTHDKISAYYDTGTGVNEQLVIHSYVPHGNKASYYVSARRVIIADGIHKISKLYINMDDELRITTMGLPAPVEMPFTTSSPDNNVYVPVVSNDIGMGIERGNIIQYCYTVEDKYGVESNPSPIVTLEHMRVKYLTADNILGYKYYHKSTKLLLLNLPQPEYERGIIKYYNIYRRDVPFRSETIAAQFSMVKQVQIVDPASLVSVPDQSQYGTEYIKYDRHVAPVAQTISGIDNVIFGAVSKTPDKTFPFIFDEFLEIKLTNENTADYLNGYVAIAVPLKKPGEWDFTAIVDLLQTEHRTSCIRLFHQDMITPCQTYFRTGVKNNIPYLYLLTKVPEIRMLGDTVIYLCMVLDPADGKGCTGTWAEDKSDQGDLRGFLRGVFTQGNEATDHMMFADSAPQNNRHKMCMDTRLIYDGSYSITNSDDDTGISFYMPNRANNTSQSRFYLPTFWAHDNAQGGQHVTKLVPLPPYSPTLDKWRPFNNRFASNSADWIYGYVSDPDNHIPRVEPAVARIQAIGTLLTYLEFGYLQLANVPWYDNACTDIFSIDGRDYRSHDDGYGNSIVTYENADDRYKFGIYRPYGSVAKVKVYLQAGAESVGHFEIDIANLKTNNLLTFKVIICGRSMLVRCYDVDGAYVEGSYIDTRNILDGIRKGVFGEGAANIQRNIAIHYAKLKPMSLHRVEIFDMENHIVTEDVLRGRLHSIAHRMTQYDEMIGGDPATSPETWDNKNINIERRKFNEDLKEYQIRWSDETGENFPPLNFLQVNEPVLAVLGMPSFLKFQYQNTLLYMTRNSIKRIVLGDQFLVLAQKPEDVIQEFAAYGLYAPGSLAEISQGIIWLSEAGVIYWTAEGMTNISAGVLDLKHEGRPNDFTGAFFPDKYQYWLYDAGKNVCYVFHLEGTRWTRFTDINARVMINLNRGENFENKLILIGDNVYAYPGKNKLDNKKAYILTAQYRTEHTKPIRIRFLWEGRQPQRVEAHTHNELLEGANMSAVFEPPDLPRMRWVNFPIGFWGEYIQFKLHGFDDFVRIEMDFKETV